MKAQKKTDLTIDHKNITSIEKEAKPNTENKTINNTTILLKMIENMGRNIYDLAMFCDRCPCNCSIDIKNHEGTSELKCVGRIIEFFEIEAKK